MLKTILKRALQVIPTLLVVVTFTFIATRMIPGDPVTAMVGDEYSAEKVEELRQSMGLNDPLIVQYGRYLSDVCHGDFGMSFYYGEPALQVIARRLPNTLLLSVTSLCIAVLFGILLGCASAVKQSTIWDYLLTLLSMFGISAPAFWVAIMFVLLFSVNLGWLPTFGMAELSKGLGEFLSHLALPCLCLSIIPMASITRITRSSMINSLGGESIRALRARGMKERVIIWRHALKNALPPIVTVLALQLAGCFSGAVLVEGVFSWPGMGTMIQTAIDNRDYSLIQATVLVIAIAFVFVNLLADIAYMLINPKVASNAKEGGL